MSSFGSQSTPGYQFTQYGRVSSTDSMVVNLWGSFQGNGSSAPLVSQIRGSWFTVSRVGDVAGHYRVQLLLNVLAAYSGNPATAASAGGAGNGWPVGLLAEPDVYLISETPGTKPAYGNGTTTGYSLQTSRLDKVNTATLNTFDIWCTNGTIGSGAFAAADVTTADRVFFNLSFKEIGYVP